MRRSGLLVALGLAAIAGLALMPDARAGTITYTPNADANGQDSFRYRVSDGQASSEATVTVAVTPVNDPPVAGDGQVPFLCNDGATCRFPSLFFTMNSTDPEGDPRTVGSASATYGTVVVAPGSPTVDYTAPEGFDGVDTITFHVNDGMTDSLNTATAQVFVVNG